MRHTVNPQQGRLFDPFEGMIPPLGRDRIQKGWQGIFRTCLLELMPAQQLGRHFSPTMGRPTKELYSVAGLLLAIYGGGRAREFFFLPNTTGATLGLFAILPWLVGLGFSLAEPQRGPHDRIAGTYLVPK